MKTDVDQRRPYRGFTLMELLLTAGLASALILVIAFGFRTVGGLIGKSRSSHDLEVEGLAASTQLTRLLRQADPSSLVLASGPGGPWSHIRFVSGLHRYEFYGDNRTLFFQADQLEPKIISTHLIAIQFSLKRAHLPTLLTWSLHLGNAAESLLSAQLSLSGTQFLDNPAE